MTLRSDTSICFATYVTSGDVAPRVGALCTKESSALYNFGILMSF